ncbi:MAG: hypothetical protein A2231_07625 [Candidatus Firestonebacteria bacterium RIFOXYA2_FULL_40_8]|nr:MAG: hypothetical protein A2231_07625 [Candidatus Firestonebacteria bacterium RIFOXYA2_FULL_40_8]
MGMGGAYTALSDDASGVLWNPAGLLDMKYSEISSTYLKGIADTGQGYFNYVAFLEKGKNAIGFSVKTLNSGEYEIRKPDWGDYFSVANAQTEYLYIATYSQMIINYFAVGVNAKLYSSSIAQGLPIWIICGDMGLMYKDTFLGNMIKIGLSIQNIGPEIKYFESGDPMPLKYNFGLSYSLLLNSECFVVSALDINKSIDSNIKVNIGLEGTYLSKYKLRVGYRFRSDTDWLTLGFGYCLDEFLTLDYAYMFNKVEGIGDKHYLTLSVYLIGGLENTTYDNLNLNDCSLSTEELELGVTKLEILRITKNCKIRIYNAKTTELLQEIDENIFGNKGWVIWDGKDNKGEFVPAGSYLLHIFDDKGNKNMKTIKIINNREGVLK